MAEKNWEQAIKHLENALAIGYNNPDYTLALAECYFNMGEVKLSINLLQKVVQIKPKKFEARETLIKALIATKQFDAARNVTTSSIPLFPKKVVLQYYLSFALFNIRQLKLAVDIFQNAIVLDPKPLKKIITLYPEIATHSLFASVIELFKKKKGK
jgi:tetratricopeptide (TPR) repeat protein